MNRAQRRTKQQRTDMAIKAENQPLTMGHGFTDTHIVIDFSIPVTRLFMTPAEAQALTAAVQESIAKQTEARMRSLNG